MRAWNASSVPHENHGHMRLNQRVRPALGPKQRAAHAKDLRMADFCPTWRRIRTVLLPKTQDLACLVDITG